MKFSNFFGLNWQDAFKSFLMAIGTAVFTIVAQSIQNNIWTFDWTTIWHTALAAAVVYLGKNLFTPAPKSVSIDPGRTSVVDSTTNRTIIHSNN